MIKILHLYIIWLTAISKSMNKFLTSILSFCLLIHCHAFLFSKANPILCCFKHHQHEMQQRSLTIIPPHASLLASGISQGVVDLCVSWNTNGASPHIDICGLWNALAKDCPLASSFLQNPFQKYTLLGLFFSNTLGNFLQIIHWMNLYHPNCFEVCIYI